MNVIFISLDTLRADRLSCLGHPRGLTPNLDRIASEGALFTQAYASDIPTQPSHTGVFTGLFGVNSDIVSHYHAASNLEEGISWLPSIFQDKGFSTGAVDHLFSMKRWFVRGYSDYISPPGRSRSPGSVINSFAFPWLEANKEQDFFLFLHFWDAHIPYTPPAPFKEKYTKSSAAWTDPLMMQQLRTRPSYPLFKRNLYDHLDAKPNLDYIADLYDAEIAYLDFEINRLFSHLEELGILDETMVVLFGDHGENMTEHDAWFDHAGLYDSVTHVPLIIWAPGLVPQARVESMVQLVDVKPTILDLFGMPPVEGLDGRSLVPVMKGETQTHRDVVYLSECTWQAKRGIRTADWKFIRCIDPGIYPRSEDELYDLHRDPEEQHNLARAHPEIAADLAAQLTTWLDEQLQGCPDPMLEVVAGGLPALARLDSILDEAPPEGHQIVDHPTAEQPVVGTIGAVVATRLPTAAIMTAGNSLPQTTSGNDLALAGGAPPEQKRPNRRRAVFVAVAAVLAILALIFTATSIFSGDVQAAGVLQPAQTVELNFPINGQINSLWVTPGYAVHKGQVLATQNSAALNSKLQADQAQLAAAQAMLANGPTPQRTPQQLQSQVAEAQATLASAQTKASNQASLDALAVSNSNGQVATAQATLANDQQSTTSVCSAGSQGSTAQCDAATHQDAVDQAAVTAAEGAYQLALSQQRTDASNSGTAIAEAQAALSSAQADEAAGTQPQTQTEVSSEQAAVNAAQANVAADQKAIAEAELVAPFSGTIAAVNGSTGDLAGPDGIAESSPQSGISTPSSGITLFPSAPVTQNSNGPQRAPLITLESRDMNVVVQVPESDIGRIHSGQGALVTFPASSGIVQSARVVTIEPTAVNQSGKVYFLVHLELVSSEGRPLPGPARLNGLNGLSADVTFN